MIQPKYSPQEALERVKLMMKYDMGKTLNENKGIVLEQESFGPTETAKIADQIGYSLSYDVESDDLIDVGNILKEKVFGKIWDEGGCLLNKVIDYYAQLKSDRGPDAGLGGQGLSSGADNLIDDINDAEESGEPQFSDIKKRLIKIINDELNNFCKTKTPTPKPSTPTPKPSTPTPKPPKSGGKTGGGAPSVKIPSELGDKTGVMNFQDWLDQNKPGWASGYQGGVVSKGRGYGSFGPRTQKAWAAYGKEFLSGGKKQEIKVDTDIEDVDATNATEI